jgi:hypothetical protein
MGARFTSVVALAVSAVLLSLAPGALAYEFGPNVRQIAPEQTVFDWSTQRCADDHIPDGPARAFKDSNGQVQLMTSSDVNRRMIGPTLDTVGVDCTVTMSSHSNADPAAYDDKEWLNAFWTPDGKTIAALVHEEYEGWEHPGMCAFQGAPKHPKLATIPPPREFPNVDLTCWYNSVTTATSTDSGLTYTHATPPSQLSASVPYQYVPDLPPYGYFEPSNIIRRSDGYFYSMIYAEAYGAQQVGVCVVRSRNPASPTSWRAWDGAGYNVKFINPYIDPGPPEQHVCQPVSFDEIEKMNSNVTYNTFFQKYLLIGATGLYDPGTGEVVYGVYYSTSSDLVHWSMRQLVMKAELLWTYQCGDEDPIAYPSALLQTSSRNFETTGKKVWLYFTRFNDENCFLGLDRDLIRIPIEFLSTTNPTPTP